jgi:hypothetical protein
VKTSTIASHTKDRLSPTNCTGELTHGLELLRLPQGDLEVLARRHVLHDGDGEDGLAALIADERRRLHGPYGRPVAADVALLDLSSRRRQGSAVRAARRVRARVEERPHVDRVGRVHPLEDVLPDRRVARLPEHVAERGVALGDGAVERDVHDPHRGGLEDGLEPIALGGEASVELRRQRGRGRPAVVREPRVRVAHLLQ